LNDSRHARLLAKSLNLIAQHPTFHATFDGGHICSLQFRA